MACSRSEHVLTPAHAFCYISLYTRPARSMTARRNVRARMRIMPHAKPAVHTSQRQRRRTWVIALLFQGAGQFFSANFVSHHPPSFILLTKLITEIKICSGNTTGQPF